MSDATSERETALVNALASIRLSCQNYGSPAHIKVDDIARIAGDALTTWRAIRSIPTKGMETDMSLQAWWFEPKGGALRYDDGRVPVAGETHEVYGRPKTCEHGLHASVRALDALDYAESNVIWRVALSGEIAHGDDKVCATHRKYIQRLDIEPILRECACRFALSVIHLWSAPPVVREFLMTGDESLRVAANAAARATASSAARAAASAAASAAAWGATSAAASAAAWGATWDAAWSTTRAAAWDATRAAQNNLLETLILRAMEAA